ncbi:WD domain-containing protein [Histomonas meleagridis]|uniref:WD domain-containing protein n=1 Tax=Histomonas meleagridis TaxID=135588 RepID=UPI00355A02C5|nr:WD domain-containing protein [Histomonas meleagridis]KAH0805411.1 WD domain-containing protein [Histomonas meleagridis]
MFQKVGEILIPGDNPPSFVYLGYSAGSAIVAATTSDRQLYICDHSTFQVISSFQAHNADISGVYLAENSNIIATCCEDGQGTIGNEVSLWDSKSSQLICTFGASSYVHYVETCHCVGMNKSGKILAAGTNSGVLTWDVRKPEGIFRHVNIQPEEVSSIEFHPFASSTFLSGDDDGNLLLYDLDGPNQEDSILFYSNDNNPVFQCGFCGVDTVFTLRRTAGIRLWNIFDNTKDVFYDDLRNDTDNSFSYPIDAHWCGEYVMTVGGDSEGGVALVLCSQSEVKLFGKLEKAHNECVNASYLHIFDDGSMHLLLAGDAGQMTFWRKSESE